MMLFEQERVTLVVEEVAIRLLSVTRGAVTRWGSAPLTAGMLRADGAVAEPELLAQTLDRLWHSHEDGTPPPREGLVLAIPGHRAVSRLVPLPPNEAQGQGTLLEAAAREAVPGDNLYHAWQVVGPQARPLLFVVATPTEIVDSYVDALQQAQLGLAVIDLKPLAVVRGVGQRHAVVVEVERARATIIIVEDALPRLVRYCALDAPLLASPETKVIRVVEVLRDTINYYNARDEHSPLHPAVPVYLVGSLGEHPLVEAVVREVLRYPLGKITSPIAVPAELPLTQFVANIGLAQKRL